MKFSTSLLLILPALCAASRHIDGGLDCRTDAQQGTLKCCKFPKPLFKTGFPTLMHT